MFEDFITMLKRMKKLSIGQLTVFFHVPILDSPHPERYNARYGTWKESSEMSMNDWDAVLEGTKEFMSESCLRSVRGTDYSQRAKSM